jgi:ABC-2 type transport system ATP-binding protein/heme exporter protein A
MLQRLALARALLHDPALLLLDEAETGLDARAHEWLISALGERGSGRTVIFASHDIGFVCEVADEVVFLRAGRVAGRVQTAGLGPDDLRARYADALAARSTAKRSANGAEGVVGVAGQAEP